MSDPDATGAVTLTEARLHCTVCDEDFVGHAHACSGPGPRLEALEKRIAELEALVAELASELHGGGRFA